MAWEWVPPVSAATSTAIIGGIGIWATFRAGREGRQHAETLAKQTAAHAERMAFDARQQKRFEEAYIDMLQVAGRAYHWASRVLMDYDPPQPLPDLPSPDEEVRVRALVSAYGSGKVRKLLGEFRDVMNSIRIAVDTVTFAQSRSLGEMESEYRIKLDRELRPALRAKHHELEDLVAEELRKSVFG